MLVINYGSELVSRVQALNARFPPVAGAPDHQSAGGYELPASGELGRGKGQALDLCLTALLAEGLRSTQHSSAAKISTDSTCRKLFFPPPFFLFF